MPLGPMKDIGNLKWGSLYLPILSYAYIFYNIEQQTIPLEFFNTPEIYLIAAVICLIGSVQFHGILRAIFGSGGPEENPKHTLTSLQHMVGIVTGVDPDSLGESYLGLSVPIANNLTLKMTLRMLFFGVPIGIYYILTYISVIPLAFVSLTVGGYAGGLLLIAQLIFLLQSTIWTFLPSPEREPENADTPEYLASNSQSADEEEKEEAVEKEPEPRPEL